MTRLPQHASRLVSAVMLAVCLVACRDGGHPPTIQAPQRPARPALRIVALTDLSGYLAPCGCQTRPLGGLDKAASRLHELHADGVPTLVISAGNLFFGATDEHGHAAPSTADPVAPGAATQQRWEAETLAKILRRLSVAAATPGAADVERGTDALAALQRLGGFPLLAANHRTSTNRIFEDSALFNEGGLTVGVWGLTDFNSSRSAPAPADLLASAHKLTTALRARGATLVIGLLASDPRTARRIAGATRGLDFLLHGGTDSAETPPPERVGQTTLLRAAHRGHGLLVVDVTRTGPGSFVDVSVWSRQAQRSALAQRISELAARISEWERDKATDRALLDEQRARLARVRAELSALDKHASVRGNSFSARFIELGPETASDPEIRSLLDAHDKRVNAHNRTALANLLPPPVAKGEPSYVGATRCGQCHAEALIWWQKHAHGRAYATLEKVDKQWSLSCVSCHVTGYGKPGGSTVVHNEGLTNVGCESCHGPGSMHAEDPDTDDAKNVHSDAGEALCVQCHNAEHSDHFAYAKYRAKLIVPGHGLPAVGAMK